MALALHLAGFQQVLHQLEDRNDVPALLWVLLIRRQKLRQHQDDRSEQALRRIVEKGILSAVAVITIGVNNGFGKDLGVLLRLGSSRQVLGIFSCDVHVAVDQCQQVVAV